MKYRKQLVITTAAATILIIGPFCLALSLKKNKHHHQLIISQPATPVEVTKVVIANLPDQVSALGSLAADQSVTISPEVNGRIAKIFFKDGQNVVQGMPIIQLDNAKDQANYDSALAALSVTRNKYHRAQKLWNEGAISKQDLEQLKADTESKAAAVKNALASLNQKKLTAPFSGILGAFKVQEGDFINQGAALVTLVNTKQLKVKYSLPEVLRPQLKLDQEVAITTAAYPKKIFYGTVTYISPSIDVATRSIALQAELNNNDNLLSPGMFVQAVQNIAIKKNALIIPEQAITADISGYSVFIIKNRRAHKINVKIGARVAGKVQILQGVKVNDLVVTAGQQKLADNDLVKIIMRN